MHAPLADWQCASSGLAGVDAGPERWWTEPGAAVARL